MYSWSDFSTIVLHAFVLILVPFLFWLIVIPSHNSIAEVDLLTGSEISRRRIDDNEISSTKRPNKPRSRSIASSSYKVTTTSSTTPSDINLKLRSRSRYRSTTEKSVNNNELITLQSPPAVSTTPIVFRRRIKANKPTPTTTTTTTSTTTTTRRPTTIKTTPTPKDEDEEAEYYYYYYDEDEEPTSPQVDLFQKSPTQRTTGLRTETFTPSTSTVQLHQHQQLTLGGTSTVTGGDRGFAKRNLETQTPPKINNKKTTSKTTLFEENKKSTSPAPSANLNINSFNPGLSHHKWSDRAVVPLSEKIKLKGDGSVECLDKGIFPHPISCKQFVHCVPGEENDGSLRAWVYSCPQLLTFDPVGGMCNYDEFANQRAPGGNNACIE